MRPLFAFFPVSTHLRPDIPWRSARRDTSGQSLSTSISSLPPSRARARPPPERANRARKFSSIHPTPRRPKSSTLHPPRRTRPAPIARRHVARAHALSTVNAERFAASGRALTAQDLRNFALRSPPATNAFASFAVVVVDANMSARAIVPPRARAARASRAPRGPCASACPRASRARVRRHASTTTTTTTTGAMDASRDGISKLMLAEREAQAIVGAAREGAHAIADDGRWETDGRATRTGTDGRRRGAGKTARLRAAVEEARGEIAAYRAEREARYAQLVAEVRRANARARERERRARRDEREDGGETDGRLVLTRLAANRE